MSTTEIIAVIVALGGWGTALLQYYLGYRERRDQREDALLAQTLKCFEGKSQRRSVGISLVEGLWAPKMKKMNILVPVLVNQIVYLLHSSKSVDAVHEERNLIRLLTLLKRCIPKTTSPNEYYPEILDAILRKDLNHQEKGIPLSIQTLRIWYEKFGGDIETFDAEHQL
jgi:hypothetical protein